MTYSQSKMAWFGLDGSCAVLLAGFSAIKNQSVMEHASSVLRKHGIPVSSNDNRRSSDIVHRLVAPAGTRPPVRLLPNVITGEFGSTIYFSGECSEEVIEAIRVIQNCPTLIPDRSQHYGFSIGVAPVSSPARNPFLECNENH